MSGPDSFPAFTAEAEPRLRGTALLLTGDRRQAAALVTSALAATRRRWRRLEPAAAVPAARAALVRTVLTGAVPETARRLGDDLADDDLAWSVVGEPELAEPELADPGLTLSDRAWLTGLAGLPVRARVALVLRLHDGLADDETARLLGTDAATVAGLVAAALRDVGPLLDEAPESEEPPVQGLPVQHLPVQQAPVRQAPVADPDDDLDPYAIYRRPR